MSGSPLNMAQQQSHIQQVVNTTNLLVRAIDRLQQSSGESASISGSSLQPRVTANLPGSSRVPISANLPGPSHLPTASEPSYQAPRVSSELSGLFGWSRKRSSARIPPGSKKKKRSYRRGLTPFIV